LPVIDTKKEEAKAGQSLEDAKRRAAEGVPHSLIERQLLHSKQQELPPLI